MALCKAMILVGALLLVTTFQMRIKQVSDLAPHQPQEDQEEPTEAPAKDDALKGQTGKAEEEGEEDAADVAVAAAGEAFTGLALSRDPSDKTVSAFAAVAGEDAAEEAEPMAEAKPEVDQEADQAVKDEQAAAPRKDTEPISKPIQQGREKGGKGKKSEGKHTLQATTEPRGDPASKKMVKQDQDELAPAAPEKQQAQRLAQNQNAQRRKAKQVAEAEGPESAEEQKNGSPTLGDSWATKAKKAAAKHKADTLKRKDDTPAKKTYTEKTMKNAGDAAADKTAEKMPAGAWQRNKSQAPAPAKKTYTEKTMKNAGDAAADKTAEKMPGGAWQRNKSQAPVPAKKTYTEKTMKNAGDAAARDPARLLKLGLLSIGVKRPETLVNGPSLMHTLA